MTYKKLDKVVELVVGGSVINGPTPSSFIVLYKAKKKALRSLELITKGLHGLVFDLLVADLVEWLDVVRSAVQQLTNQEKHG